MKTVLVPSPVFVQPYVYPMYDPTDMSPYFDNMQQQTPDQQILYPSSPPSPTFSTYSNPDGQPNSAVWDIPNEYALSCINGLYPHLTTDKCLAELYPGSSEQMHLVWHGVFKLTTAALPGEFSIEPAFGNIPKDQSWTDVSLDAKVRFKCRGCGKGWTSMKGKAVFFYKYDYVTCQGQVKFQLYGQKCTSCSRSEYEHAMWYPQEVVRILKSVTYNMGQSLFRIPKPKILKVRRGGSPKEKHEKEMCQACQHGLCSGAN